jgi:protein-disulfide isomerase
MHRKLLLPFLLWSAACATPAPPPVIQLPPPTPAPVASAPPPPVAVVALPGEESVAVPISPKNPAWGSRVAPVTIVEFSDFQCPYCARVESTLEQIKTTYGPDTLRIVWKNDPLPFHPNAQPAAEAGAGVFAVAGNDAFWKFHDLVFKNQSALGRESYLIWAQETGVTDMPSYAAGLDSHVWLETVDKDLNEGKTTGVQGTPSFFINGVFLNGAQPFDDFKKIIDQELEKAHSKIGSGTSPALVYAEMTSENRKNAPPPRAPASGAPDDTKTVFKMPLGSSPALGSANALVTIVEFADFQCPFCARVEPTVKAIRDKYGDKVRFVWKNLPLPFHPGAEPAAQAALEVRTEKGDAAFWSAHDKLLAGHASLANGRDADVAAIVQIAVEAGASADRVRKAIDGHTHKGPLQTDQDLADDFQANGTPHFFINGRRLVGAQPEERFDAIIDDEIARAQALLDAGTRPGGLYDALIKDGKGPPAPEKRDLPAGLPTSDPARGNLHAKVIVHEWSDFQCPFCGRVEPTLAQLLKDYGGRVKFVWHDLPLHMHPDAALAAEAGREAYAQKGPTGFWAMHDKLFANQQSLKRSDLDSYAQGMGLNPDRWNAALDGGTHTDEIEADEKTAGDAGILGTPAFLIVPANAPGGYFVNGAQAYSKYRRLIDRALVEAR